MLWLAAIVGTAGIGYLVYLWVNFEPEVERFCPLCREVRPWHLTKGCSVCRTLDSVF